MNESNTWERFDDDDRCRSRNCREDRFKVGLRCELTVILSFRWVAVNLTYRIMYNINIQQ